MRCAIPPYACSLATSGRARSPGPPAAADRSWFGSGRNRESNQPGNDVDGQGHDDIEEEGQHAMNEQVAPQAMILDLYV
jgi:hypothetical protein